MAAALPMAGVQAWRVYLGLPMFGPRMPAGGPDEIARLANEDALLNLFGPIVEQAAAEFPEALAALRSELPLEEGPIGVVGGSAGGAVALSVLASGEVPAAVAAVINPVVIPSAIIVEGERVYGMTYRWTTESRALEQRLDFVKRAGEIGGLDPQPAVLLVGGAEDDPSNRSSLAAFRDALGEQYADAGRLGFVTVEGMGHAMADEPGIEPAPQTSGAAQVDAAVSEWFNRHLAAGGGTA
jgi:dienelactone hydrolase